MIPEAPFNPELLVNNKRITVSRLYEQTISAADDWRGKSKSPFPAKSLLEVPGLIKGCLEHYQQRAGIAEDDYLFFTTEMPDFERKTEAVTYSVVSSLPGGRGRGGPLDQPSKELKPFLRESIEDPDAPGYKRAVLGHWHDNIIRLTCWAKTSWRAEERVYWVEKVMKEYAWFFALQGISRLYFWERHRDEMREISGNKIYGKPLDFFVRTEEITIISEKMLEDIVIKLSVESI